MAGDRLLPRVGAAGVDGPLAGGGLADRGAGGARGRARDRGGHLRAADRDHDPAAVHRNAHSRNAFGLRARPAGAGSGVPGGARKADRSGGASGAVRQRAAVGLAGLSRHDDADPGAAHLLRVSRLRRGPLRHRRPVAPGDAVAPRARYPPVAGRASALGQSALHLHARLRGGDGGGQPDHFGGASGAVRAGRSAAGEEREPEADAAGDLLRRGDARAGVRADQRDGVQLPFG